MKKKKKRLNNNNGITLIALVVTIIVLIILAGVSISLVLGDNGIITKAKQGKENTELAKIEEEVQLNETVEYLENFNKKPGESGYQGGNYDDPYIPVGFIHIGEETWNNGYTIKDGLGNEFVWIPCVTDVSKIKSGDNVELFKKTTQGKYNSSALSLAPTNINIVDSEPTEAIRTSVGIYGGFYIAKYEAGIKGTTENYSLEEKTITDGTEKALSQAGKGVWNAISRTEAIKIAENMINTEDGVKSGLISGECWDTTLQWIVNSSENSKKEPNVGYDINSNNKGWYNSPKRNVTGYYSINNIYDMAGNVWEWTTENCIKDGNNSFVVRGGAQYDVGSNIPAASRFYNNDGKLDSIGFRVILYK